MSDEQPLTSPVPDNRLYVPETEQWKAFIKSDWDKTYCFAKNPGEDFYHLIVHGEIYLRRGDEVYCLKCALRHGFATTDRLFWQHRGRGEDRSDRLI